MDKKNTERYILEKFVSNKSLKLPVISIKDWETPDFIIKTPTNKISIELTSLFDPDLKEKESFQNSIIEKAEKIFEKTFSDKLRVLITFSKNPIKCSKSKMDKYAFEIFEIVRNIYLNNKEYEFSISNSNRYEPINEYIDKLHIDNTFDFSNWQSFGAFIVDYVDFNLLKGVIINKEKKIKKYSEKFDENWLVMVANFGTKSSARRFDYINYEDLKSAFNRIFVYKYFENNIIKIK